MSGKREVSPERGHARYGPLQNAQRDREKICGYAHTADGVFPATRLFRVSIIALKGYFLPQSCASSPAVLAVSLLVVPVKSDFLLSRSVRASFTTLRISWIPSCKNSMIGLLVYKSMCCFLKRGDDDNASMENPTP